MKPQRARGLAAQAIAYAVAFAAAGATLWLAPIADPLWRAAAADLAATLVVFGFSVALSNSSMYDPYWSVAPPALFLYWLAVGAPSTRAFVAGVLVFAWGARLTWNFLRGWPGLGHEDWRYPALRAKTGKAYWLVSFLGIHFFPSVMTFVGSLSLFVMLREETRPLGLLDALALVVTVLGVGYEAIADEQLRAFKQSKPPAGAFLADGLWRHSRHPNYFGEVTFWTGLALFAIAADPSAWWVLAGPVAILALFLFVSIPMIDERMVERRRDYAAHMKKVSRLVPWRVR